MSTAQHYDPTRRERRWEPERSGWPAVDFRYLTRRAACASPQGGSFSCLERVLVFDGVSPTAGGSMEMMSKTEAALPPTGDEKRSERIVTAMASTDPHKALAFIAQQRAAEARRRSWKRASLAALGLAMVVAPLTIPLFRQPSVAGARVSGTPPMAPANAARPVAAAPAAVAPAGAEQLAPAVTATSPDDPSAGCESHFAAHQWRMAMESCSAAFDASPSPALAMRVAHAHWAHGDSAGAGSWGRRALELGTKDADAYVLIGNSERAAGNRAEAVAAYRRYLELAPRGWHAARLRTAVRTLTPASASKPRAQR